MRLDIELQYFPPIISCYALLKSSHIEYRVYESWARQSFRNRMTLAGANGLIELSIPVVGGRNQKAMYQDIRIDHSGDWQVRHWRTIFSAYGKSPWYFQYAAELETLYRVKDEFLVDWNFRCLEWVFRVLKGIGLKDENTSSSSPGPVEDLRDRILPSNFQDESLGPFPRYTQVFEDRIGFQPDLSILDMVFCTGPAAGDKLRSFSGLASIFPEK